MRRIHPAQQIHENWLAHYRKVIGPLLQGDSTVGTGEQDYRTGMLQSNARMTGLTTAPCPNCGYCPTCGKMSGVTSPYLSPSLPRWEPTSMPGVVIPTPTTSTPLPPRLPITSTTGHPHFPGEVIPTDSRGFPLSPHTPECVAEARADADNEFVASPFLGPLSKLP
jgi:hypothetical protein